MFKINLKEKNAITLIALVITIIVLLILAGISLSLIIGEGGILTRATKARKANDIAGVKEKIELKAAEYSHDYLEKRYVKQELPANSKAGDFVASKIKEYATANSTLDNCNITYTENTKTITITQNGYSETGTILEDGSITWETSTNQGGDSETTDNSQSLVLALVDDLGTRSTIYLYNNTDKITEGDITITMPDSSTSTIVAQADTSEIVYDANVNKYATYTVAKNGTYTFSATANGETTETKVKVENIEKFTAIETLAEQEGLSYAGGKENAYTYKGAAVPKGYYVDTKSEVNTGLVVTDEIDDEGYSLGNEWVWVPVNSTVGNDDYYGEENEPTPLGGVTEVTYTKYSKLYSFVDKTRESYGTFHAFGKSTVNSLGATSSTKGYREIAILTKTRYGETGKYKLINNRTTGTAFANVTDVATQYRDDYDKMVASVDHYGGFYIGRYEITANGEKPGTSLNTTWYNFYNQSLTYGSSYTESGMIYGALWDATMQWLAYSNISVGYTENTYSGYGNYRTEVVEVNSDTTTLSIKPQGGSQKLLTGQTSYTKSNNVFDLSGNCADWTQEALGDSLRVARGGFFDSHDSAYTDPAKRTCETPLNYEKGFSARPYFHIR